MSNASNIIQVATDLQANCTKVEIIAQARALGWKGDHARAPMLQLALYVATKLASGERGQDFGQNREAPQGDRKAEQGEQQQGNDQAQGEQQQGNDQAQGEQSGNDQAQGQQQQPANGAESPPAGAQDAGQGQASGEDSKPSGGESGACGDDSKQEQGDDSKQEQGDDSKQEQGDDSKQEQQPEQSDDDAEWRDMLKAAGIDRPHALLRKLFVLTAKARQNVLLVGPAGTGKTYLASQLAQLLRLPFSSISCTMGMSESQLTGWLLPVGEAGRFDYVPAPFATSFQSPSVFLLDEVDAADPNVLMLLNSATSNGFITIPQKLSAPTLKRHDDMILIAGANTNGSGADDLYSARAALDAATIDRFYPLAVDYDQSYEKSLFVLPGQKSRARAAAWEPSKAPITQETLDHLKGWFFALRTETKKARLSKVVSSRLAQRLVASVAAGVPVEEAKADLLLGWSDDERTRCKAGV